MKRVGWVAFGLLAATVAVTAAALMKVSFSFGPVVTTCYANEEIDPAKRQAIEGEARQFIGTLLGPSPRDAYARMSAAGRASATAVQIKAAAGQFKGERETSPPTVTRTLFIDGLFGAPAVTKTACALREANGPELVSFSSAPKEAHVLLTEGLVNAARTFDVWLVQDDGRWRVNGFSGNLSALGGRDGETLWRQAKAQRAQGHLFNATFLYQAAEQTLNRGAFYQLPDFAAFSKDLATFKPPPELAGSRPYNWELNGRTFAVTQVEMVALDHGQTMLAIYQPSPNWKDVSDADRRNRETIAAFLIAHPEWSETFDAIVVRSAMPGSNQFFGSVYEKGKGYLPAKSPG